MSAIITQTAPSRVIRAAAKNPAAPTSSLLELVRSLDGSKEERFNVAHAALNTAYTLALTHGNKTQLTQVLESTGKKQCEKAMRNAVQVVGVPGLHKDATTRADAIESLVLLALDLFAAVACKPAAVKAPKAKDETPAPANSAVSESEAGEGEQSAPATAAAPVALSFAAVHAYAAALDDTALAALAADLLKLIEARAVPMLKVA